MGRAFKKNYPLSEEGVGVALEHFRTCGHRCEPAPARNQQKVKDPGYDLWLAGADDWIRVEVTRLTGTFGDANSKEELMDRRKTLLFHTVDRLKEATVADKRPDMGVILTTKMNGLLRFDIPADGEEQAAGWRKSFEFNPGLRREVWQWRVPIETMEWEEVRH